MKTQHDDARQEDPGGFKADNTWDLAFILEKLRDTECSLLRETRFFDSNTLLHVAASLGHDQIVEAILSKQEPEVLLAATNSSGDLPLHVAVNAGHLPIVQHLVKSSSCSCKLLKEENKEGITPLHLALIKTCSRSPEYKYHQVASFLTETVRKAEDAELMEFKSEFGHEAEDEELMESESGSGHEAEDEELMESESGSGHKAEDGELMESKSGSDNYESERKEIIYSKAGATDKGKRTEKPPEKPPEKLKSPVILMEFESGSEFRTGLSDAEMKPDNYKFERNKRIYSKAGATEKGRHTEGSCIECYEGKGCGDAAMRKAFINLNRPERSLQKSKNKVTSMDPELYKAVKRKDMGFIRNKATDTERPALSDKTPELNTILHLAAASSDNEQFVQEILEIELCRQFLAEKNTNGDLPLHVAVSAGNLQIVKLLAASVPLMEKNMEENTPLHLALIKKFQVGRNFALKAKYNKVAKFLVDKCPEVSFYPNRERKTPLYLTTEGGDEELTKHMIKTNCLPEGISIAHAAFNYLMTTTNKSIAHAAIYGSFTARKEDILDTVLQSLPNDILTVKYDERMTPLTYAASIGYLRGVESLLGETTIPCVYGENTRYYPIHIATWKGHIKVVAKFLHKYPDMIELLTDAGQNILHVAAMYGKAKMLAYMLKRHDLKVEMLINNKDQNGNTPLHLAAMRRHPMVVSMLTWDKRVDLKALNNKGERALDIALNYSGENPSFRERLTWEALRYISGPRAPPRRVSGENPQCSKDGTTLSTDKYKDRTGTLLLVATLVAGVTFAAAFTMPGGYKESGGMAKFLEKPMFHVFVISNSIAMYSAITAVVTFIWAYLDDLNLFIAAYKFGVPVLGLAITMVSLAFMAGNYLVLRDNNWLAYLVLSIGSFFLFTLSIIFFPLCLPNSSPHPIIRYILRYPFHLLIKFTGCDTDDFDECRETGCDTDDFDECRETGCDTDDSEEGSSLHTSS